jgi:hypothetical protein
MPAGITKDKARRRKNILKRKDPTTGRTLSNEILEDLALKAKIDFLTIYFFK